MTDLDQVANDFNEGESEGVPEALHDRESDRNGNVDNRRWRYAVREVEAMHHAGPGIWTQVGPAPLMIANEQVFQGVGPDSGEVVDIAIDPRADDPHTGNARIIYAAAGSGGLWKTTDGGTSWRPMTDQLPAIAVGAVAIDPAHPDTLYIGTGNLFNGMNGMPKAAGLFKSVDAGRSWSRLNSPAGRPPQPITAAVNNAGGVRVTVAGHGYASLDRVVAVGLPGVIGAAGEGTVRRIDDNTLQIRGVSIKAGAIAGATLFDARQPPFLSDRGVIRMVCPGGGHLLVASETGLYYSSTAGRDFGANHPAYNDGKPIRTGLISALELDQGWTRTLRVAGATPSSPIAVTMPEHGFVTGDPVVLGGVTDNRAANGLWTADVVDDDHITLRGSSGNGTGAVTGFAIGPAHPRTVAVTGATNPAAPNPIVITCAAHGFITGDIVAVSGVGGNTGANGSWPIEVRSPDTFALAGSRGSGAFTAGGVVDGPRHSPALPVTAAANAGLNVTATITGHRLINGDRVSVLGLPGIAAPHNSASVRVIDANHVRLTGLHLNAPYGGVGATLTGPADAWNTVYFASAGRLLNSTTVNPERGLFRLTITSTGELVQSGNLLGNTGGPSPQFGRVAFCQSLFDLLDPVLGGGPVQRTRTLYISVQDNEQGGIFKGLFHSQDFGGTWQVRPAFNPRVHLDDATSHQTSYDLLVAVDPQDSSRVYAAQQQLWRSLDSGSTWPSFTPITRGGVDRINGLGPSPSLTLMHWDNHELVFPPATWWEWSAGNPVIPTPAYHGTDGGIARSGGTLRGPMTFTGLNEGLATSLLTSIDIGRGAGNNAATFAGMQDTGTGGHRKGDAIGVWVEGIDGDGSSIAVDSFDPDIVFGMGNGNLIRSTNGGNTWFRANTPGLAEIQGMTNANPVAVTTAGHPYRTGDTVVIAGVPGGGGLTNGASAITVVDSRTFTLNGKNGAAAAPFGPFPVAAGDRYLLQRDITATTLQAPIEVETATPHGCATGQKVRIDAVEGNVAANNSDARPFWVVTVISATRLSLDGSDGTLSSPYAARTGRMRGPAVNGPVPVFGTVNSNPIVVTAQGHGFVTGDQVTITGVTGNTAANVAGAPIAVLDANSFVLTGVAGNGAGGPRPRVSGPSIGRGLPPTSYINRIALVPRAGGPSTKVFVAQDRTLFRSLNGGISFVPMANFSDFITAVHAPDDHRLWLATGDLMPNATNRVYRVRFSTTDGASFDGTAQQFATGTGALSFISQIIEDPAVPNGQRVAVVAAGYSRTATSRRTRHVFVTENQGRTTGGATPWHELGGVFDAPSGNLPDVPVMGAAWDTSVNPSRLLIASDSGVFRLNPAGPSWERIGPNLPRAGVQAIATDTSVNPPIIRIGTYGRSAWEFTVPAGPRLHIEADLGFGDQQVGTTVRRRMVLHSVGTADLQITAIDGATGDVAVESVPAGATFPLTLASGVRRSFDVVFTPSATGDRGAFLMVSSNDPEHPAIEVKVTGLGIAAGAPRLSVRAFLEFGRVRVGTPSDSVLEIRNVGDAPLPITTQPAIDTHGSNRFSVVAPLAVPLSIPPSGSVPVTVRFDPNANGFAHGALTIMGGTQGQVVTLVGEGLTTAAGMVAVLFQQLGIGDPPDAIA